MLWLLLLLLVVLRGLATFLPPMLGWGLNLQRYLGPVSGWGLWSIGALSLLPLASTRVSLEALGDSLATSTAALLWVGLGSSLIAWLLPDRVWFVGDFLMRLGNVESNFLSSNYWGALPLDSFLHFVLLRPIGFGSQEAANTALRLLGAIEAGVLGVLAVQFSRAIQLRGSGAVATTAIVLFGGYLTMFTGLGKPASEMCLVVLGLGIAGVRVIRGQGSLLPAGLISATALVLHRSSLVLVPAMGFIGAAWWRSQGPGRRRLGWRGWVALALPGAAAAWTVPYIVWFAYQYDLSHHFVTASVRQHGILSATFSLEHLRGLGNLLSALSPLWIVAAVLSPVDRSSPGDPVRRFLLTIVLSFVPLMLLVHPQQGLFRDWDVFAPAGVAFSMLTAYVVRKPLAKPECKYLALPLILGALVPSVQWLLLNTQPSAGLTRVRTYLIEHQAPSDLEEALTWDFLTARYMRLSSWPEAADAGAHAAALAPHRRILLMWALAETMKPDDRAAEQVYQRLLAKDPEDALAWIGLAGTSARLGQPELQRQAVAKIQSFESNPRKMEEIRRHLEHYPQVWSGGGRSWPTR